MRRSGKSFGFGKILLRFGELLSLPVGDPFHHCFAHRDISATKGGGKRFSQDRKSLLKIRLIKEYLCFQYFEPPIPFQVLVCESRQCGVDVLERFVRVIVTQSPENLIVSSLKKCR